MTTLNATPVAASAAAPGAALNLTKIAPGQKISLTKEHPNLSKITLGLGWNPRRTDGKEFDLDAACMAVGSDGKLRSPNDLVCYLPGYTQHPSGAVIHNGDNKNGQGEGDDETLSVDLNLVPAEISKLVFTVSIYAARQRSQNFGMVDGAYARLIDATSGKELYRFDLTEDASTNTAVIFVRLYRHNGEWKFEGVGQGFTGGFKRLCAEHGLEVEEEIE